MTLPQFWHKIRLYSQLIRFEKPIGSYLLLWPTLWALAIAAEGEPDHWVLFVFISGVFLMRSAGCAINDYADRDIDMHVARLRDKLRDDSLHPQILLTVRGKGYMFAKAD